MQDIVIKIRRYNRILDISYLQKMNDKLTIKEEFLPLANRLLFYESGDYLITSEESYSGLYDEDKPDYDYEEIIQHVCVRTNLYDSEEVYFEAKKYSKQVKGIIEKLVPKTKHISHQQPAQELTAEQQEKFMLDCKMELLTYTYYLNIVLRNNYNKYKDQKERSKVVFHLHEGFKVGDITQDFHPLLSPKNAALLLHYFTELGITPSYAKGNLARLATPLFGLSEQTTRTQMTNVYDLRDDINEVEQVKSVLIKLIAALDRGLTD